MERETTFDRQLFNDGLGDAYGLTSQNSKRPGIVRADALVVIAVNLDEEMVALLYDLASPCVVATTVSDTAIHWKRIAATFDEFMQAIGLVDRQS